MSSLFSVTNNVSLVSINVAPSTYLASFIILVVFLALYIPRLSLAAVPRLSLPAVPKFLRESWAQARSGAERPLPELPIGDYGYDRDYDYDYGYYEGHRRRGLDQDRNRLILQDQSLVVSRPDLVPAGSYRQQQQQQQQQRRQRQRNRRQGILAPSSPPSSDHERESRRSRRLFGGLRDADGARGPAPLPGAQRLGPERRRGFEIPSASTSAAPSPRRGREGRVREGSPGLGERFYRWVLPAGVAKARQRRSEQRLLEGPR
jgi:hypothetical protein